MWGTPSSTSATWRVGEVARARESLLLREIFSVHQRFSTSLAYPRNQTIFHLRTNHSQLQRVLESRVFSQESFNVTFSATRSQDDQTLTFSFQQNSTILSGSQNKVWEEKSIFEFGKLNDLLIEFSNNSITFINKKGMGSISIDGIFGNFRFIGFYSEKPTSWVIAQSKII